MQFTLSKTRCINFDLHQITLLMWSYRFIKEFTLMLLLKHNLRLVTL